MRTKASAEIALLTTMNLDPNQSSSSPRSSTIECAEEVAISEADDVEPGRGISVGTYPTAGEAISATVARPTGTLIQKHHRHE